MKALNVLEIAFILFIIFITFIKIKNKDKIEFESLFNILLIFNK